MGGEDPYSAFRDPTVMVLVGIVLGTLVAMVIGLGGPAGIAGNESSPVFPLPDSDDGDAERAVELRIDVNRSTIRPGETVTLTVERADGDPVAGATLSVDGEQYTTDGDGTVAVTFDRGGEYTATATASDEDVRFVDARRTIRVDRYVTGLDLRANATRVTAGEAVRFTVTDGEDPVDATVAVAGTDHSTGADGTVVVAFDRAGEFAATARKQSTATTRFAEASVDVSVDRRRSSLSIAVLADDPVAHEPIPLLVTRDDTGGPANATVSVDGETYHAGEDGRVNVTLDVAGDVAFSASAPDTPAVTFADATRRVTVDRRTVGLSLAANRTTVPKGEAVAFELTRDDTGAPVDGTVAVGNATHRTGADGTVAVTFEDPGSAVVGASRNDTATETFRGDATILTVRGAQFSVTGFDAPAEVARGENVTVAVNVTNAGNEPGTDWVAYRFDGERVDSEYVALDPGESQTIELTATVPSNATAGERSHGVVTADDDVASTVVVTDEGAHAALRAMPPLPRTGIAT